LTTGLRPLVSTPPAR